MITNRFLEEMKKSKTIIIQNKIDAGLKKDSHGYYRYTEKIGNVFENGTEFRAYGQGKTAEKCAESFIKDYKKKLEMLENQQKPITLTEVAREWLNIEIKSAGIAQGTKNVYEHNVEKEIIPYFNNKMIIALKSKDYTLFINRYAGCGESKVKKLVITLNRILKYAYKNGYSNIEFSVNRPTNYKPIKPIGVLDKNILRMLCNLYNSGDSIAEDYMILLCTGMRPKEATQLEFSDVDLEEKSIHIKASKTASGIRDIPISDLVCEILKRRIEEAKNLNLNTEYVFRGINNPNKPVSVTGLEDRLNTCFRKIDIINGAKVYRNQIVESTIGGKPQNKRDGLKYPYKLYQLRHSYATLLDEFQIKDSVIKEVMGHSQKNDVTQHHYTHRTIKAKRRALKPFLDSIDKYIKNENYDIESIIDEYFENENID